MDNIFNKRGFVNIYGDIIFSFKVNDFKALFSNFYPIKIIDEIITKRCFAYYGYSEHFRELKEGEEIPNYDLEFKRNENNTIEFVSAKEILK